ncbi:MAG TPA: amino acid adenylation domain-containing protein, partial [Pyrinomonadaceae bacterium]|nr:amino acid adenylation domain-containing protein [Pyrinomonadaceae bacterium]
GVAAPPLVRTERVEGAGTALSFAQQRLWFLDRLEPESAFYNSPLAVRLTGALDVAALTGTLDEIVRRHEVLRTTFAEVEGTPVQVVGAAEPHNLELVDLGGLAEAEREAEARRLASEEARKPFDLSTGPLLRAKLLRLAEEEHVVLLTMHHIVSDGWSLGVLVREVAVLYEAFSRGEESPLPELPIQYADYAAWQREWLQGEVLEAQVSYWKKQLEELPVLELPTDRPRPPAQSFRGAQLSLHIPEETLRGLKELSRREGCTLFMTLLAAFQLLLSRYSGQEDIIVGTPIAGRTRAEAEGLIGFFVNTLALRTDLSGDPTFVELMKRVREVTLGAYAHQEVPFEKLVEELRPERDTSRQPLFQVMFAMQNAPTGGGGARLAGLELTPASSGAGATSKFDLMLTVTERGGELAASFEYATDLFDQESIERMASHLKTLLTGVVSAAPGTPVWRLPLMCEEERLRVVSEWNRTQRDYDRSATLHGFFEQQAAATPDAVAVSFEGERLTYRELNEHANRLAHHLASLGVGTESRVGVLLTRRPELLVSLLAVMKAGGCYVPLDPAYPRERLSFMLEDASASVLVTAGSLRGLLPAHGASVVNLEAWRQETTTYSADNPSCAAGPQNLAYLIYTSGSTGRPKAVAIEHRSAATLLHWAKESFTPEELSGVLASTSVCFDLSVFELFVPLSCGGKVILAENALALPGLPAASEVTLVNTVPSAMAELIRQKSVPPGVKVVNLAGEALKRSLVDGVYGASAVERVLNLYGPSEDTTYSTFTQVARDEAGEPTIGKPLANTRVYVVDAHMRPVPVGVPGELLIGGEGLARGYLGRPALTAERFVPDPFGGQEGERLYRTGDLVRFLPDGRLEFRGRLDHQVKVRGFRIELGEIEAALLKHASVREAVAVVREAKTGDKRLVAYCVAVEGSSVGVGELREHLRGRLPEYMVPTAFVALERLPLTPNGKLDRRALPEPGTGGEEYVAPRNEIEAALAEMWVELLGVERIGVNDNFFELGGHSLLATQVVSRVREAFRVELPLVGIFQTPTVAGLAEAVAVCREQQQGTEQPSIKRVEHDREEALLARLDEMSAEDIEALLSDMSTVE